MFCTVQCSFKEWIKIFACITSVEAIIWLTIAYITNTILALVKFDNTSF